VLPSSFAFNGSPLQASSCDDPAAGAASGSVGRGGDGTSGSGSSKHTALEDDIMASIQRQVAVRMQEAKEVCMQEHLVQVVVMVCVCRAHSLSSRVSNTEFAHFTRSARRPASSRGRTTQRVSMYDFGMRLLTWPLFGALFLQKETAEAAERQRVRDEESARVAAVMKAIDDQRSSLTRAVDSLNTTVQVLQAARDAAAEVRVSVWLSDFCEHVCVGSGRWAFAKEPPPPTHSDSKNIV
jgi:hypothetical protein